MYLNIISPILYLLIIPFIFSIIFFGLFSRIFKNCKHNKIANILSICICFLIINIIVIGRDLSPNIFVSNIRNILIMIGLICVYLIVVIVNAKILKKSYRGVINGTIVLPLISISIYSGLVFSYSPVEIGFIRGLILSLLFLLVYFMCKIYKAILIIIDNINKKA